MTIRVTGLRSSLSGLDRDIEQEVDRALRSRTLRLFGDLRVETPVDTGRARNSWDIELRGKQRIGRGLEVDNRDVINSTNYIQYLNDGTSVQAPANFIEAAALRYFDDAVVEVYDDPRGNNP